MKDLKTKKVYVRKVSTDAKVIVDASLNRFKGITFLSGKDEEVKKITFDLSF